MWFSLSQLLKKILKQANKQKENKKSLQFSKLSILRVKFPWKNSHFLEFFHPGSSVIWGISLPPTPYSHLVSSRSVDFKASSVQSLSCVWLFATTWTTACQASHFITNSWNLLKLMSIESVMPSNNLILCRHPSPPTFNLSQHQGLFQWVSSLHQVAKVLEFQLQHQSFQWMFGTDFL